MLLYFVRKYYYFCMKCIMHTNSDQTHRPTWLLVSPFCRTFHDLKPLFLYIIWVLHSREAYTPRNSFPSHRWWMPAAAAAAAQNQTSRLAETLERHHTNATFPDDSRKTVAINTKNGKILSPLNDVAVEHAAGNWPPQRGAVCVCECVCEWV